MSPLVGTISALMLACAPASGQDKPIVATHIGVKLPALIGVLANPPVLDVRTSGNSITGTTTTSVRANAPWQLTVSLVTPIDPSLTASFRIGKGRTTTLTAAAPTAVVTFGSGACLRCSVTVAWDFTYKAKGSRKPVLTVPKLLFEARSTLTG